MFRESSQLLAKVFELLRDPLEMSRSDVAAELKILPGKLNEYAFSI
ncbi:MULTISPECIES: hypothetical protein [unclassified Streptomyces]|nr:MULTISPECIES: hypothetical protein [unclassified Streptomyces]